MSNQIQTIEGRIMSSELKIGDSIKVTIAKFDPNKDAEPYYVTHTVPYAKEMRILEALDYIVEELGESLAYRWFCGVKKCGGCAMQVNGRPLLGCWEPVEAEMIIEPLPNFPVIRDLVVDRDAYDEDLALIEPAMQRTEPYTSYPEPLTSTTMKGAAEMLGCIECMICVSTCPAYDETYKGPALMVQLARFQLDPRDGGPRAKLAIEVGGIDKCVSCHQCTLVCPSGIAVFENAIGTLRDEARAQGIATKFTVRDRFFGNIHTVAKVGSKLAPIVNPIVAAKPVRWMMEKAFRIDRRRSMPTFSPVSFEKWFSERISPQPTGKEVLLFHDTFMTYMDLEIAIAATELIEAAGYDVLLAEKRECCGRPMLSKQMVNEARSKAKHNLEVLLPYAEKGIPIVGVEPSCLLMIKEEYPRLVPGPEARLVSEQCYTIEDFLANVAVDDQGKSVLQFEGEDQKLLVHGHCHQKALIGMQSEEKALTFVDGFQFQEIPSSCCGMAGSHGFETENYERSIVAAEEILAPAIRESGDDVAIVASGTSCRQQIEHTTGRKAQHPVILLHEALKKSQNGK
jgi:succinate dehydrogenase/fumarate reductase iron-sulfur protein